MQGSHGAEFHSEIKSELFEEVVRKGLDRTVDSYSAFKDNSRDSQTELDALLKENTITDLYVVGLPGDFCVYWTALDGKELNYNVNFIMDATRSVFANPDLGEALLEIGVDVVKSEDLI
ncbi:MAG: isochorismatase family protein [Crocinitomicaceae bacterium]|nr:isochorismatase family protein [Crocinitomicaceae bacterium]